MEFGAIPPHDPDPSKINEPKGQSKVEKDLHDLSGLTVPRGSSEARRIAQLLRRPTEKALNEARGILYDTQSRPVLTFTGAYLAKVLAAEHVQFAVDLLKGGALHSTDAFLRGLVAREYKAIRNGLASPIAGADMVPLRVAIASLCVDPALYFSAKTRKHHQGEIDKLLLFPIVLLRRAAGHEVASVFVKAATRGGIEPESNRRGYEGLTHIEEANPGQRVIPAEQVSAILSTMGSFLRDSLNHMDTYAFVERWLQKPAPHSSGADGPIAAVLHCLWNEYRGGSGLGQEHVMDVIALLRHFDDPVSQMIVEQAANDSDKGIALLARLCRVGPTPCVVSDIHQTALQGGSAEERHKALRVLGYSLSAEHDVALRPVFSELVTRAFGDTGPTLDFGSDVVGARSSLISVMARRMFTQPLKASFIADVFSDASRQNVAEASLMASTLLGIARQGRIMPLAFYDDPSLLAPIALSIELLRYQAKRIDSSLVDIADAIEGHFILDGPARFGFQLARTQG